MATDRTTENHVHAAIRENRRRAARWVCWIGIPLVIIASIICLDGAWLWVLIWLICLRATRCTASTVKLAGAAGEDRALAMLLRLPSEYILFNQIRLPDERSRTGFREADFVMVGPGGVFIVENKCNHHLLHGK